MKNTLIISGEYELFLNTKRAFYLLGEYNYNEEDSYLDIIPDKTKIHECFKIYRANRQRKHNNWNELCKWVYAIEKIPCYKKFKLVFGTLTFRDNVLASTSERTRARYVTWYLKENTFHYVANIDFGKKNNREHYHFIAMVEDKVNGNAWKYGGNKIKFVKWTKKDIKSCKNYLLKLNNHSYKESTKQKRIIRDRREDKFLDTYLETIASEDFHRFKLYLNAYEEKK